MHESKTHHRVHAKSLQAADDIVFEILHEPLPFFVVAVGAAVDDKAPFVPTSLDHAPYCGGEQLSRPIESIALFDEPLKS